LCPDWIYSDSSNVHVTKDKTWFTSYQPFESQLGSVYNIGTPERVLGIGTVELAVKALPGSFMSSTIELHNVLHVPSSICNVLGRPLADVYDIVRGGSVHEGGPSSRGGLFLRGQQIAHFQPGPISFFSLAVLPPPGSNFGVSAFKDGPIWSVSCLWDHNERLRWQALQSQSMQKLKPPRCESLYTVRELEWLYEHWGTEFRFLSQHRLKICDEADRSEGRRMVRALMAGRDPSIKEEED
ncbi:hypothetical protein EJ07DRAFT_69799, partial [Lizonia empirigonia]